MSRLAVQESIGFLEHDAITRQFHVAHFRGCATLFNKDTFGPDLQVKSIYAPSERAYCSGWALEAVISKARFALIPRHGKSSFATKSLHCHSAVDKKRSIAQNVFSAVCTPMIQGNIDLVVDDFNGESCRRKVGADQQYDSTYEEAFKNARLPVPPPYGVLAALLTNGPMCAES